MKRRIWIVLIMGSLILTIPYTGYSVTSNILQKKQTDLGPVNKSEPLKVNKDKRTIYIYAEVNGKYLYEPTRHGVVFKDGRNGDKSIFKAYANALDFWDAFNIINATPGNNVTKNSPQGTIVQGDIVEVKAYWRSASREYF